MNRREVLAGLLSLPFWKPDEVYSTVVTIGDLSAKPDFIEVFHDGTDCNLNSARDVYINDLSYALAEQVDRNFFKLIDDDGNEAVFHEPIKKITLVETHVEQSEDCVICCGDPSSSGFESDVHGAS